MGLIIESIDLHLQLKKWEIANIANCGLFVVEHDTWMGGRTTTIVLRCPSRILRSKRKINKGEKFRGNFLSKEDQYYPKLGEFGHQLILVRQTFLLFLFLLFFFFFLWSWESCKIEWAKEDSIAWFYSLDSSITLARDIAQINTYFSGCHYY